MDGHGRQGSCQCNKNWLWAKLERVIFEDSERKRQKEICVDNFIHNFERQLGDPNSRLARQIDRDLNTEDDRMVFTKPSIFTTFVGDREYPLWKCMSDLPYDYDRQQEIQKRMEKITQDTPIHAIYKHYDHLGSHISIFWNRDKKRE